VAFGKFGKLVVPVTVVMVTETLSVIFAIFVIYFKVVIRRK